MSTPLTDRINALTSQVNTVTGAPDTTLTDAVGTLTAGYADVPKEMSAGSNQFLGEEIVIPDDVETIGALAFSGRYPAKVTGVGVKTIGNRAFSVYGGSGNMPFEFDFPNLEQTASYVFERHDFGGKAVVIAAKYLGNDTFDTCKNLTSVKYTRALEIGIDQLYNTSSITTVIINSVPTWIHGRAFRSSSALTDIYVPWSEGEVGNAPWGATNATIHYDTVFDANGDPII